MDIHKKLAIDLDTFGFVEREKVNGRRLTNKCGRDFLYYALTYFVPELHNTLKGNPEELSITGKFGIPWIPSSLVWTGLTFKDAPAYFKTLGLAWEINGRVIKSYADFMLAMLPLRSQPFERGIQQIENEVNNGNAVGVDIAITLGGLADHVMFVYGYDDDNLYVFDTHHAPGIEYEKLTPQGDMRYIFKLPKSEVKKRWTVFNRVWVVRRGA